MICGPDDSHSASLGFRVGRHDGVANVPRRDALPGSRRLHLHSGALRAEVHRVRDIQRALVGHGHCPISLVWGGLDRECGGVLSGIRGGFAPGPGVGSRGLHLELGFRDNRDTDCKR